MGKNMSRENLLNEIRNALGDYMWAEGCACCRIQDDWEDAAERLGKLLGVPKYEDGSGYDFYSLRTPKENER